MNTTLYTGVTSNLRRRTEQHRSRFFPRSFSAHYSVNRLVYYRAFARIEEAIAEEKRIKGGSRRKKIALIEAMNPTWEDLWEKELQYW